jgi:hypothetical protein
MLCSLNEIESEVRKAARGVGLAWGLAEEAGWAARFLATRQLPSISVFVTFFDWREGRGHNAVSPIVEEPIWRAHGGRLCAITTATAWQDFLGCSMSSGSMHFDNTSAPLLFAPFVAAVSSRLGRSLVLQWPGVALFFSENRVWFAGNREELSRSRIAAMNIGDRPPGPDATLCASNWRGVSIDDQDWSRLTDYAARTYVPSSAASRLYGAGAGLLDND